MAVRSEVFSNSFISILREELGRMVVTSMIASILNTIPNFHLSIENQMFPFREDHLICLRWIALITLFSEGLIYINFGLSTGLLYSLYNFNMW